MGWSIHKIQTGWKERLFFLPLTTLLALYSVVSQSLPQERLLKLVIDGDTAKPIAVAGYDQGGLTYLSLNDFAGTVGLGLFWNEETKKLELKSRHLRIKVTARNPFVVVTDLTSNTSSVYQLPVPAEFRGRKVYVPTTFFLPLFNFHSDKRISLFVPGRPAALEPSPTASPFDITGLSVEPKLNGYVVRIKATRRLSEFESWLKPDGWLYVTIANARADVNKINAVKSVEIFSKVLAIQHPTSVQLTFKLMREIASSEITTDPSGNDILLLLRVPTEAERLTAEKERQAMLAAIEDARRRWKLDVIVIDPGHGGHDAGAIGITGVKEKDITLNIGLMLGRLIEKNLKGVKVVYTRKSDTFVELYRRGQIANAAGGKLFISIHCNSMPRKPHPQNGFEIYLLRPGRTEDAVRIAERENSVIKLEKGYEQRYQELTEENFILVTMAQSAYMKYSERFAEILHQEISNRIPLANNGVKQAGFYVLVGASMPNVLIETGYLSNRNDERFLKSKKGQQAIAEAIFAAVKKYKAEYEKALYGRREVESSDSFRE